MVPPSRGMLLRPGRQRGDGGLRSASGRGRRGLVQARCMPVELLAADGDAEAQAKVEHNLLEEWGGKGLGLWGEAE